MAIVACLGVVLAIAGCGTGDSLSGVRAEGALFVQQPVDITTLSLMLREQLAGG